MDAEFWEDQYRTELAEPFDWFFDFGDLDLETWNQLLGPKDARILVLGCGHSSLSEDMAKHGWTGVVSMDSSATVIAAMQQQAPELQWFVADARDLSTLPGTVAVVSLQTQPHFLH